MEASRFEQICSLFRQALDFEGSSRVAFLDRACPEDERLRRELDALLEAHEDSRVLPKTSASEALMGARDEVLGHSWTKRLHAQFGEGVDPGIDLNRAPDSVTKPMALSHQGRPSSKAVSGRYQVEGEIAQGGMGIVFNVWDEDLRRNVAMKAILQEKNERPTPQTPDGIRLSRFLEEAQITAQLDHPGVVPVHELGFDERGRAYFTMKLVNGMTLRDVFDLVWEGREGWNETRALGVILRVCEAMAFAHSKGVIHRDLKPANIMVGPFGETLVMDWGLGKVVGREDSHDCRLQDPESETDEVDFRTRSGDIVGTPAYMPREQALGLVDQVGPAADVYATGAILYHLLCGRMPFVGPGERVSSYQLLRRVQTEIPTPLSHCRTDIAPELIAICEKAMSRDARDRYVDMNEMAEDLRAFLENRVVRAYRSGAFIEFQKWVSRNRGTAAALLAVVIVLIAGVIVSNVLLRREAQARASAELSEQKAREEERQASALALAFEDFLTSPNPYKGQSHDVRVRDVLEGSLETALEGLESFPLMKARFRLAAAETYRHLGDFQEARKQVERALEIHRATLGRDDPETLTTLNNLATLLWDLGERHEAKDLVAESLAAKERTLGPEDPSTLTARQNLASALRQLGEFEKAREQLETAIEVARRTLGEDHFLILQYRNELATTLADLGLLEESRALFLEVLDARERILGEEHAHVLDTRNGLARVLTELGELEAARDLLKRILILRERDFGRDNRDVLVTRNNLASVLGRLGELEEAKSLVEDTLSIVQTTLGAEHPTAQAMSTNLSRLVRALENRAREQKSLLERPGTTATPRWRTVCQHAATLRALERNDEAIIQLSDMIGRIEEDGDSEETALSHLQLEMARSLMEEGRLAESGDYLLEAFDVFAEKPSEEWRGIFEALGDLVGLLIEAGKSDEAVEFEELMSQLDSTESDGG